MSDPIPICKNCRWFQETDSLLAWMHGGHNCLHPQTNPSVDIINGTVYPDKCHNQRKVGSTLAHLLDMCGREGRFFEKAPPEPTKDPRFSAFPEAADLHDYVKHRKEGTT